ncbi:MAG: inorganic phosphate transporter [Ignavibacteria bacterium]|nr:inorganic phosphate transporter [Ignavibacteria bacterium]
MELYLFIVIILFILAISDLIVGVANDAVNFLNSAIGSKVAPRHIIMTVASLGIMAGVGFSSGIMEVARKGIFHPDMFTMSEIMIVFISVMIADIILLDSFNTFGLPTSTTVSIVFDLLGASVGVALIKVLSSSEGNLNVLQFINTNQALTIVSGILISVIVAFTVGMIVQYICRIIFTFDYTKYLKKFGGIWAGFALTSISYFIVVKGAKDTTFLSNESIGWIENNAGILFLYCFIFCTAVFQLLIVFTKINVFKPIVLVGTFGLALAFAANDLVNFIGVPLAGLASYNFASLVSDPDNMLMTALKGKVSTPEIILLLSGVIMVITLWKSKKAKTVTDTTLNLSRQHEGFERFESSAISRNLVRMNIAASNGIIKVIPGKISSFVRKRFDTKPDESKISPKDKPSFDFIRASNNLAVASILISFATSLKLPLSTTYVTFMVAMGTSLADKAWGRDSAVYRVNGVITVIGGWFFTAFSAFTLAFISAIIIYFGGIYAIIGLVILVFFIIYKSHIKYNDKFGDEDAELITAFSKENKAKLLDSLYLELQKFLRKIPPILNDTISAFEIEDRVKLKEEKKEAKKIKKKANNLTNEILQSIGQFKNDEIKAGKRFGKIISSIQEIANRLNNSVTAYFEHIENNHNLPSEIQMSELKATITNLREEINCAVKVLESKNYAEMGIFLSEHEKFQAKVNELDINQISRIQTNADSTRNSLLFLNLLANMEIMSNQILRMMNALRNISAEKKPEILEVSKN